ncbi:MAG: NAD-dependent succinate-semialdehyde dehydrogenase [Gammaproteobacteria bacterium]|nr:NAD-dependent succinate-semialdehyde dehydrogenase [Gammaproteobacteria bacterium]
MYPKLEIFVAGQWKSGNNRPTESVINPADESVIGQLPHATADDLDYAVESAVRGFNLWRSASAQQKADVLNKAADIVAVRKDNNAEIMTLEQGKTLAESAGEWDRVVDTLRWHAQAVYELADVAYPARAGGLVQHSQLEPVGVALALTAWNFPAILPVRKLAPALAAGCSVILKAAEETPASAIELVRALQDAGLPNGVVNLIFGVPSEVSGYMLQRKEIRKLSFTGSVPVGKLLAGQAAMGLKRCTLELGGHAPAIVFDDADVQNAVNLIAGFKYRNAGQVCIAPSRVYVHEKIVDDFTNGFVEFANNLVVGDGRDDATQMGPMANSRRIEAMQSLTDDALAKGARLLTGGAGKQDKGFYWQPSVLNNVPDNADILQQEPFGPVAPIVSFSDYDELISRVNGLEYGLASYVFTQSEQRQEKLIDDIECGGIAVNTVTPAQPDTPFGGVKESGYGYEGGMAGINAYLNQKLVSRV